MKNIILIAVISGFFLGTPVAHAAGACEIGASDVNLLIKKILDEPDTAPKVLAKAADHVPSSTELRQQILASGPSGVENEDKFVSVVTSDGGRRGVRITGHQDGHIFGDVSTIGPDGKHLIVSRELTPDELTTMKRSVTSRKGFEGMPETPKTAAPLEPIQLSHQGPTPVQYGVAGYAPNPENIRVVNQQLSREDIVQFTRRVPGSESRYPAGTEFKFKGLKEPTDAQILRSGDKAPPSLAILEGPDGREFSVDPADIETLQVVRKGNGRQFVDSAAEFRAQRAAVAQAEAKKAADAAVQKMAAAAKKANGAKSDPGKSGDLPEDIQRYKVEAAARKANEDAAREARNQELKRLENNQLQYEKDVSDYKKESGPAIHQFQQDSAFDDRAVVTVTRLNASGKLEPVQGRLIGDPSQTSDVLKIQTPSGAEEIPYNRIQRVENPQGHGRDFPTPINPEKLAKDLPTPWMKPDGTPGVYRSYSSSNPNQKILELLRKPPPHTIIKVSSPEIRNLSGSEFEIIGRKEFSATIKNRGQQVYRDPATIPNDLIEVRFLSGPREGQTTTFDPRDLNYLEIVH